MIFTNTTFKGHYPVGTAAVVRAANRQEAADLLNAELKSQGLTQKVGENDMIPFTSTLNVVRILCDGNY